MNRLTYLASIFLLILVIVAGILLYFELNQDASLQLPQQEVVQPSTFLPNKNSITTSSTTKTLVSDETSSSSQNATKEPRVVKIVTRASTSSTSQAKPPIITPQTTSLVTPPPTNPTPEPNPPVPDQPYEPLEWGVFTGSNASAIRTFERKIDKNPDYLAYFVHWGNQEGKLPTFLKDVAHRKDRTLVLFWEASDYQVGGTNQPAYAYRNILNGNWDDYFEDFADQLKAYQGPIILIPFSELNGNWTPWSGTVNGNTPQEAVQAFRYIHGYVSHLDNVQVGWAVNAYSVPNTHENQIENYYPGDDYVDIVGVDGFNEASPWLTFDEIFNRPLTILSNYNKPVFIFSFASAEGNGKANWMEDAFFTQMPKYPQLKAWIWFNQDKEHNWLVWSDKKSLAVFERALEPEKD